MIHGRRVLLTGGGGFIRTTPARRLLAPHDSVNFHHGTPHAPPATRPAEPTPLQGNLGGGPRPPPPGRAVRGCQMVVHLAAIAGVDTVLRMPVTTMKVNMIGTYNVLEAAVSAGGVERFIDFSTSEVFGSYAYKVSEGDVTALGAIGEARWTYAVSKLATQHLAHNYRIDHALPALSVRPFNIYGPGQVGEAAIHRFIVP